MGSRVLAAVAALVLMAPGAATAQRASFGLDDAAIVGIFDAANTWDIVTGSLAATKGSRKEVREFGAQLARDHKSVQQQGRDLAKRLGVTPPTMSADFELKKNHVEIMRRLEAASGAEFDRLFLEHEVAYHKAVIGAVTSQLLPAIRNAELKAFVEKVAPAFAAHMAMAEGLTKK